MTIIKRYILSVLFTLIFAVAGIGFNAVPVQASSQVLFAGYPDALNSANATEYNLVGGGHTWMSSTLRSQIVSTAGKIKNLYVELSAAAGTGADDTYTFTLMYDGAATALTCAIVQSATSGSDTTHEIDVAAGKVIMLRCVSSGSPSNTPNAQWSMMFSGTTANESLILGTGGPNTTTAYFPLSQAAAAASSANVGARQTCPTAGKIKNLYLGSNSATGTSFAVTLYKNGGAQTLTQTVLCNGTANDLVHEVDVAAGDTLSWQCVANTVSVGGNMSVSVTFVATTDGESLILGTSTGVLDAANVKYNALSTSVYYEAWNATETKEQRLVQICVLKNLYVLLNTAPANGAGTQSFTFTVESNTATATSITTTISEAEMTGNDITHTATLAAGDNIALMCTPSGTPIANSQAKWGLVCYIAPLYDITNSPDSKAFGIVAPNTIYYAKGSAPNNPVVAGDCTFTVTNTGNGAENIAIKATNFTGGAGWTLASSVGENQVKMQAYKVGDNLTTDNITLTTSAQAFIHELAIGATKQWDFSLATGTFTDGAVKTDNITLTSTAH